MLRFDKDDNFLNEFFNDTLKPMVDIPVNNLKKMSNRMTMRTDIEKTPTHIIFKVELPGFEKKDINIELEEGHLFVFAEKTEEQTNEEKQYLLKERVFNKMSRVFTIDENISENDIKAKFENGVLEITIPNKEEEKSTKVKINIE